MLSSIAVILFLKKKTERTPSIIFVYLFSCYIWINRCYITSQGYQRVLIFSVLSIHASK